MSSAFHTGPAPKPSFAWWLEGPMIGPMRKFGAAIVISVGPWLVSVVALAVLSITMTPLMGDRAVEDLRLSVVYAFALAPLIAGPVGAIAARLVRGAIEERGGSNVFEIFRVAALASGALAMTGAILVALALGIAPTGVALGFVWTTAAAALLWTSFAVLGAIRAYRFLIGSFTAGMLVAFACTIAAARNGPTVEMLVWSFDVGIAFCVVLSFRHVAARYWRESDDPGFAFWLLISETIRAWPLALGIAAAVAAIWTDKVVFWSGTEGLRSAAGFAHYAPYDAVMFVAHLSLVPSLASMLLFQNGALPEVIGAFRRSLARRSTHEEIAAASAAISTTVWAHVLSIVFVQATCSAVLVLMAPLVSGLMDFDLIQFDLLRTAIVAIFLQSLLYLSCGVLMVCNRIRTLCVIQLLFLAANLVASLVLRDLIGVNSYAVFASSMAAAVIAFIAAYRTISDYDYLVFVGENEALYDRDALIEADDAARRGLRGRMLAARAGWAALADRST